MVDDFKLSGTMGGNTTPTGVNIAYAKVQDLEQFIQFDRKSEGNVERINEIKKTILDKGYLYDTTYEGGVVFGVTVDELGNVQIAEGNHRLQALIDVAKETGQEIYVPINPILKNTSGGNKVQLTNSDNAYNSMKQLLTDMLEDNKNFDLDMTINEKLGEPGRKIVGLESYTYPGGAPGTSTTQSNIKKFFNSIGLNTITYDELPDNNIYKTGVNTFTDTPTNVVDERLTLERIIKNDIQTPPLKEGLLKRYLDYDEFVKGLPADRAEQLLDYTNKDVADKLELFKDQYNLQKPYGPGELEDINSILLDWEEPSPIEDAVLADIENWDLDTEGNPIDPRKKPEGMSKFQQELSAQYNYLLTTDTPTNVVDDVTPTQALDELDDAISKADGIDNLNKAKDIINKNPGVFRKIFSVLEKADIGDQVITKAIIPKVLPRIGLAAATGPVGMAYAAYEIALLLSDVGQATYKAQTTDESFWDNFGEISDKYSIAYKISKPVYDIILDNLNNDLTEEEDEEILFSFNR